MDVLIIALINGIVVGLGVTIGSYIANSPDSTARVCAEQAEKRVKERKNVVNNLCFCF